MATGVTGYALVNAIVRALYSRMLSSETKRALIRTKEFDQIITLLLKTVYGQHLSINNQTLTARRAIYQIRWHLAEVYEKLIRTTPEPGRQLIIQFWHLFEVDNLKATLRGIQNHASWDQVRHLLSPMAKNITLRPEDMERMLQTGDIRRAIERIHHTHYYNTLLHAVERYEREKSVFALEVALDLDYRRQMWQIIHKLKGLDHTHALNLVGTILDIDNLLWAIRYRVYHHLSEQEIINYTLPQGYRIHDDDIRAIAAGADIAAVVKSIYPNLTDLNSLITQSRGTTIPPNTWLPQLEHTLNQHVVHLCRKALSGNPFHIGVPIAYLLLNEYEIEDLTAIIEAKVSNLSNETLASVINL